MQKSSRYILAGNHRYRASVGAETLPGFWLDVDDDEAVRIMIHLTRTERLAAFDDAALLDLLVGFAHTERGLAGTGHDGDDLDDLRQMLSPPDLEKLGGGGGGPDGKDLWPVLRFKVPPAVRDRFYQATDPAEDQTDEGRFFWMLHQVDHLDPR